MRKTDVHISIVFILLLLITTITSLKVGWDTGREDLTDKLQSKLKECVYAPTPVKVGDTLYIIRVYPYTLSPDSVKTMQASY
jgi:hypothetical protein